MSIPINSQAVVYELIILIPLILSLAYLFRQFQKRFFPLIFKKHQAYSEHIDSQIDSHLHAKELQLCVNCGSFMQDGLLKARRRNNPKLISCCPERKMVNVSEVIHIYSVYYRHEGDNHA